MTNQYEQPLFTWVKTHKRLVEYLKDKENDQKSLINTLRTIGIQGLSDKNRKGDSIQLEEIDPFTFFCFIYKYSKNGLNFLRKIAEELNLDLPGDSYGIPSTNAQKVLLFPYKYERKDEIQRLWKFFKKLLNENITEKDSELLTH